MDPLGKGPKIRLRYNKIECAILGVVGLVVTNSFYRVLSGSQEVASKPLPPKAVASKLGEKAESYETKCRERGETFVTTASRVRITGPYCQGGSDTSINRSLASTP
ncbi:MAG TPA: hypothetical protein PLH57_10635, partial [Oligoflexia bacterium]|nr:hypothetical protein [Oligoflexia bacterium]